MKPFAKIFYSAKYGQILVLRDSNDVTGAPEVRCYFHPSNAGLCSFALQFSRDDGGCSMRDIAFDGTELHQAEQLIATIVSGAHPEATFESAIPGGWTATKEKLPDDDTRVLACTVTEAGAGEPFIAHHDADAGWCDDEGSCWSGVTHWQHLPDFPA